MTTSRFLTGPLKGTRWMPQTDRDLMRRVPARLARPIRRRYYVDRQLSWLGRLPPKIRRRLELDDREAIGSRKIELGPGWRPSPGYIHVDDDPWAAHVDVLVKGAELPLESDWADEILAIHILEHVPPAQVIATLSEWHRCLRRGGFAQVHVPDSRALASRFADEQDLAQKWALMGALLGMYVNPTVDHPAKISQSADHQVMFDADLLSWALGEAGFAEVEDLTGTMTDVHTEGWREVVPNFSLIFRAFK
jgi:hypothetical protein